mmetsp:Transcript_13906/g.20230  ORF Transcript_13906/g.20230 Transcript_13906/m.20230 type:complete len:193 (-) Transcript_13906:281-859(-)
MIYDSLSLPLNNTRSLSLVVFMYSCSANILASSMDFSRWSCIVCDGTTFQIFTLYPIWNIYEASGNIYEASGILMCLYFGKFDGVFKMVVYGGDGACLEQRVCQHRSELGCLSNQGSLNFFFRLLSRAPLHFGCGSRKSEANVIQVAKRAGFKFDLFVLHRVADFFSAHHGAFFRQALALSPRQSEACRRDA